MNIIQRFLLLLFLIPTVLFGQTEKYQLVVNGGAGYSFLGTSIWKFIYFPTTGQVTSVSVPYSGTVDFGLSDKFSVGLGCAYQSLTDNIDWGSFYLRKDEVVDEKMSRLNTAVRLLYHFDASDNADLYMGFRTGLSFWKETNDSGDPYFTPTIPNKTFPSIQYLLGFRLYIAAGIGIHGEIGLGTPYLAEGGLSFRIYSNKSKCKTKQ